MTCILQGQIGWSGQRDPDGHRTYKIQWAVSSDVADGPAVLFQFADLPQIGDTWTFGNDNDVWAFCWPDWVVTPVCKMREPNDLWIVEQTFSTKPLARCQTTGIESPITEPYRLSGSFVQYTKEAIQDYSGQAIRNSAFQRITGPEVEVDASRATVRVGYNSATLPLALATQYLHAINDSTLWGLDAHCVKFSNLTWQRNLYSVCTFYYTLDMDFDIRFDTFDSQIHDFGTSVLMSGGTATTPDHYIASKDKLGENRLIPLNGSGQIWNGSGIQPFQTVQFYTARNLLDLGIPSSL